MAMRRPSRARSCKPISDVINGDARVRLPQPAHQHHPGDRRQQRNVVRALDGETGRALRDRGFRPAAFLAEVMAVEKEKDDEQDAAHQDQRQKHVFGRPEKMDALEEPEKERRIAEGRKGSTDVGDEKYEEHDDMDVVPASRIRLQQGPDQKHGRARRSHDAGGHGSGREHAGVHRRRRTDSTDHADSP